MHRGVYRGWVSSVCDTFSLVQVWRKHFADVRLCMYMTDPVFSLQVSAAPLDYPASDWQDRIVCIVPTLSIV